MKNTCALLAHDQVLLTGLHAMLEPTCEIVAMADNILSFSDAVESLGPDLAVIDVSVHAPYQGNLVRHLRDRHPNLGLIILAEDEEPAAAAESLSAVDLAFIFV